MTGRALLLALAAIVGLARPAVAVPALTPIETSVVNGTRSYLIHSAILERDYQISVQLPDEPAEGGKRFPALILTDGNWALGAAQIAYAGVHDAMRTPMVLVGIGAPGSTTVAERTIRRIYEFSLPNWDMQDPFGKVVLQICQGSAVPAARCTGGAPAFSRFIREELIPALQASLPIDPQQLSLGGVSAGGFFGLWMAFQPNSPFRNYILSSPGMAYGEAELARLEAGYAGTHKDFPVGLYMGSGSLEVDDPTLEGLVHIVSGQVRVGGQLKARRYPSLRLFSEIHQGMGHVDSAPVSYARGLRLLFGK